LKDNDIVGNAKVGVLVNNGATPTVIGNRINNGQSVGVLVQEEGGGTFVGNEVSRNAKGGFVIKAKCNPTLVQNGVHDSSYFGIHVAEGALGVIKENVISGNKQAGIVIKAGARVRGRLRTQNTFYVWNNNDSCEFINKLNKLFSADVGFFAAARRAAEPDLQGGYRHIPRVARRRRCCG
jgi:hypothetical protein